MKAPWSHFLLGSTAQSDQPDTLLPFSQSGVTYIYMHTQTRKLCLCDFAGTLVPVPKSTECYWDVNLILFVGSFVSFQTFSRHAQGLRFGSEDHVY